MNDLINRTDSAANTLRTLIEQNEIVALRSSTAEFLTLQYYEVEKVLKSNGDYPKLERAQNNFKSRLSAIRRLHISSPPTPTLNYFDVHIFSSITDLSMDLCPPSTVYGLFAIRENLLHLSVTNSGITDMWKVLSPVEKKILKKLTPLILPNFQSVVPKEYLWSKMTVLKLVNCGISKIDQSMHFFPLLKVLDLSHNSITHLIHLQDCICLKHINLSHNLIRVLSNLERVVGSVSTLDVSHNEIESLDGVDKVYSLERLNVANNYIDDFAEILHLCKLPCLESIILAENPVADHTEYRLKIFLEFIQDGTLMSANRMLPSVDGKPLTKKESKQLRRFMFRATTDYHTETSYADDKYLNRDSVFGSAEDGEEADDDSLAVGDSFRFQPYVSGGNASHSGKLSKHEQALYEASAAPISTSRFAGLMGPVSSSAPAASKSDPYVPQAERKPAYGGGSSPIDISKTRTIGVASRRSMDSTSAKAVRQESPKGLNDANPSVKEPLNPNAFRSISPKGGRTQSTASRTMSVNARSLSTNRPSSMRSTSVSSNFSSLTLGERAPKTFKVRKTNRMRRIAKILAADEKETIPDIAQLEEIIRIERENGKQARLQAAMEQELKQLSEKQEQLLAAVAAVKDSQEASHRAVSMDVADSTSRMYSLSDVPRSVSVPTLSAEVRGNLGSIASKGIALGSISEEGTRGRGGSSLSEGPPPAAKISSMDDFMGKITDNTKFAAYGGMATEPAPYEPPLSTPSGRSEKHAQALLNITTTTTVGTKDRDDASKGDTGGFTGFLSRQSFSSMPLPKAPTAPQASMTVTSTAVPTGTSAVRIKITNPVGATAAAATTTLASSLGRAKGMVDYMGRPSEHEERVSEHQRDRLPEEDEEDYEETEERQRQQQEEGALEADDAFNDSYNDEFNPYEHYEAYEAEHGTGAYSWSTGNKKLGSKYRYVGDPEYSNLSVVDNLELYFREQVFGLDRPSGASPYLSQWDTYNTAATNHYFSGSSASVIFVDAPTQPERFIGLWSEKIIEMSAVSMLPVTNGATGQNENIPQETRAVLVLTDWNLYIVLQDSLDVKFVFGDAPVPLLMRVHPIYSLCNCTIFFGFQRCVLSFSDHYAIDRANDEKTAVSPAPSAAQLNEIRTRYMILTRDKAHTYPIITRMPQVANAIRNNLKITPLPNVKIENKDAQLLEVVMSYISSLGTDHDIVHYQMVYQVWRQHPGVRIPRTIVLTQSLILLCNEELANIDISLKVLECANLKDVQKVEAEDNPLFMTIVFKPSTLFSSRRKWRLVADSRNAVSRLLEECKRAVAEKGSSEA